MIRLVPRAEALRDLPLLAHTVRGVQSARDPARDYNRDYWAGNEAEGAAWFAAWSDPWPEPAARAPRHDGSMILVPRESRSEGGMDDLADAVARLMASEGDATLTLLHVSRAGRWPAERRTPPVLAGAAAWFRSIGAGEDFDGAIQADAASLREILSALYPCVRMDMGYGDVFFAPDRAPWVASLCQYGNLHLDTYGAGAAMRLAVASVDAGLVAVEECGAGEPGAIPFRALDVGEA